MKFLIYALTDPRTDEVRYIGKSTSGLKRPKEHLRPTQLKPNTHKTRWIRQLLTQGLKPKIQILEEFSTGDDLNYAECFWIAQGRGLEWKLTNATKGGDGQSKGYAPSEETRAKMREALASDPILVERAQQLYVEEQRAARDVAKALGVSNVTVSKWARAGGWSRSITEARAPDPALVERARQLYVNEKKSGREVGRFLGVASSVVFRWARAGGWSRSMRDARFNTFAEAA